MLNFLLGRDIPDSLRAFVLSISFPIRLFSVEIALFKESISSWRVTFLNRGIGLLGINSGISSSNPTRGIVPFVV